MYVARCYVDKTLGVIFCLQSILSFHSFFFMYLCIFIVLLTEFQNWGITLM